jgi:uncharacterized protein (TIGR00369 family)
LERTPPDGFSPWTRGESPVSRHWEPIYSRATDDKVELGTYVRECHCNSRGLLHGGVIAALCDVAMGHCYGAALRRDGSAATALLTTQLAVDYIGKADGGWLQITAAVVHAGRNSGIAECGVTADGRLVAHAKAAFRTVPQTE